MTRLKVGVVGAGRWGQNLIRCFSFAGADVVAICDPRRPAPEIARGAAWFPDFEGFLARSGVSAVILATPAPLHSTQGIAALRAGFHVFVEKPMALSLLDALRMREAARAEGRLLMVGHLLRYHPAVRELRRWVARGALGRIEHVAALRLGPGTKDAGDDPWWALAPHDLSLLRYLMNEELSEVSALSPSPGIVRSRVRLGGTLADVIVSAAHATKVRRLALLGSRRSACFDDSSGGALFVGDTLLRGMLPRDPLVPFEPGDGFQPIPFVATEPLAEEAAHFIAAVVRGERIATDADEGCRVTAALEAGARSMESGGAWTRVLATAPDPRAYQPAHEAAR